MFYISLVIYLQTYNIINLITILYNKYNNCYDHYYVVVTIDDTASATSSWLL